MTQSSHRLYSLLFILSCIISACYSLHIPELGKRNVSEPNPAPAPPPGQELWPIDGTSLTLVLQAGGDLDPRDASMFLRRTRRKAGLYPQDALSSGWSDQSDSGLITFSIKPSAGRIQWRQITYVLRGISEYTGKSGEYRSLEYTVWDSSRGYLASGSFGDANGLVQQNGTTTTSASASVQSFASA